MTTSDTPETPTGEAVFKAYQDPDPVTAAAIEQIVGVTKTLTPKPSAESQSEMDEKAAFEAWKANQRDETPEPTDSALTPDTPAPHKGRK